MISSVKRDQLISQQRKKLQQLRLQNDSENTKLLKIQQQQRQVQSQYQRKKQDMHQIMATLAHESQQFLNQQNNTAKQFDGQKQQIYSNDKKKQMYLKMRQQIKKSNAQKSMKIQQKKTILDSLNHQLQSLKTNISDYKIYFYFLKDLQQLSQQFSVSENDEQGVMQIIYRYQTLQNKRAQLVQKHRKIDNLKDDKIKIIQQLRSQNQDRILSYNSKIKTLKQKIDLINEQNISLESDIQGKLDQDNQRLTEIGQVIFSIRNIYQVMTKQDKPGKNNEKKQLKQKLDLYHQHIQDKKK